MPSQEDSIFKKLPQALLQTWEVVSRRLVVSSTRSSRSLEIGLLPENSSLSLSPSSKLVDDEDTKQQVPQQPLEESSSGVYDESASSSPILNHAVSTITTTTTTTTLSNPGPVLPQTLALAPLPAPIAEPVPVTNENDIYVQQLKDLQFDSIPLSANNYGTFTYARAVAASIANAEKFMRLVMEINTLSTSLPICKESSIFVRTDEERLDVIKALIIGPQDTPYAGGCFEFDIFLPDRYPQVPPQVQFLTTGNGRVRFNPNLYEGGKVCLSLLGTWTGGYGENWTPHSTLLQVLVSIQSLILVSEPYFNEPGYETSRGSAVGIEQSRLYDANIRVYTMRHAILEQLNNTASVFHEVIKRHYALRKDAVLNQVQEWVGVENPLYSNIKNAIEAISLQT